MPEIEIRPATLADLTLLVELDHTYQTSRVWQMDRTMEKGQISIHFREVRLPRPVRVEYPKAFGAEEKEWLKEAAVIVAILKGAPVGYVRLQEQDAPRMGWITDLAVSPAERRQGIGTAMVLAAQEWCTQRRIKHLIVGMQSKNYPAICLMQKLGYEFCGYNDHYYPNQDIALFFDRYLK